ncbi:3-oxoacyl-ACP synthase III family protein [Providencia vermicola]|uniref:3-oxoacyl-ACP synthase n=2 Tax=Providencia TaxID=586 RepID=A0AAI9MVI8_PROST|nr:MULTISPECIES: 3-oxoacyl-[acyl-carrier-protein] synthase III C-terminal domain-containing protein [Providencia]ELR5043000.1 3-oxoacyl-ACP synthase [Providencia rettgeri]MCR4178621.1 3-oxoacyl-ACP synthase [Providencia vermicola]MTB39674.1 3-oxoacyl-ACP synthase [Providencia sp. wls1949]MTC08333.1 3-oxoacyl-ACP synthase [Providencia sp. wls1948]ELR5035858.1 3-oxoacyl-ACP synthase [Providencia stuartii]
MLSVGIQSIAIHLPEGVRTNGWWDKDAIVRRKPSLSRSQPSPPHFYDDAMKPYLSDTFLGSVERRVVINHESASSLGIKAATKVLTAAKIPASDIDCLIVTSLFDDNIGFGDAGYIAHALGIGGGAFNISATCNGSMSAFLTACGLVQSGQKKRVLVIATAQFSRLFDADDPALRFYGDASAAFIVGSVEKSFGLLSTESIHLGETCGTWHLDVIEGQQTPISQRLRLRIDDTVSQVLRATSEYYLKRTVDSALLKANVTIEQIDCVALNTPTAWHAEFSANALGIAKERVVNTFPQNAYSGPAMVPIHLYMAATQKLIKPGSLVVLYAYGGHSEASAAVLRWSDVSLGEPPAPAFVVDHELTL